MRLVFAPLLVVLLICTLRTNAVSHGSDITVEMLADYENDGGASFLEVDSSESSEDSGFKQTVYQTAGGQATQLDRVWDTPDEEGGSTIVLSNRNSLEAWQPAPKGGLNARLKLMELKMKQARERAEEETYKQAITQAGNNKLQAIQSEQTSKSNAFSAQMWNVDLGKSRLRPTWGAEVLKPGKVVVFGNSIRKSDGVTWMLWVKPLGVIADWGNIILKGDNSDQRSPMISFYPNSTRLTVRSATVANPNNGANPDPKQTLEVGKWTHVAFTHKSGELKVYYNTEVVATTTDIEPPIANPGILYACGVGMTCANAQFFDIRYFPSALDIDHITIAAQDSTARMNAQAVSSSSSSHESGSSSSSSSSASASSSAPSSSSTPSATSSSSAPASTSASATPSSSASQPSSVAASSSRFRSRTLSPRF